MIKKIMFFVLLFLFIYVTTFNIFLTEIVKIPMPCLFLAPLLFFYKYDDVSFHYGYQLILFFISVMLYNLIGERDIASFVAFLIKLSCLIIFFNYIIGHSLQRLIISIFIFYAILFISGFVMLIDHQYNIANIRSTLALGEVIQGPSGIATTVFTFGYQMAALTPFLLTSTIMFKKNWLLSLALIALAFCFIFFGMQRSVLIAFAIAGFLFIWTYYKAKSILIFCAVFAFFFIGQGYVAQFTADKHQQNILNKNERQAGGNDMRGSLISENLKIIADYPYGLLFYNKSWNDVVQHNFVYKNGPVLMTSHNAYLMFITYLGPLLGIILLVLLYYKLCQIIWNSFKQIKLKENAMLICLSCSFIAISVNSFFHNEWLLAGSGPTLFLYFSILHLAKINSYKPHI